MKQFLEILVSIIIGIALFWLGFTLFVRFGIINRGQESNGAQGKKNVKLDNKKDVRKPKTSSSTSDGDSNRTCPVCSGQLSKGELVSSAAFPSTNGGKDRLMHIRGCVHCLNGERDRVCPVCGTVLEANEILIARLFERTGRRSHIHVIGCTRCKKGPHSGR
jgi:rubredoxin